MSWLDTACRASALTSFLSCKNPTHCSYFANSTLLHSHQTSLHFILSLSLSNFSHSTFVKGCPSFVLIYSSRSTPSLQKTMPILTSLQFLLPFRPHLRDTTVDSKRCLLPSQSPSTISKMHQPQFMLKLSSEFWKALILRSTCPRKNPTPQDSVGSSLQTSSKTSRSSSSHVLFQHLHTCRLPLSLPLSIL